MGAHIVLSLSSEPANTMLRSSDGSSGGITDKYDSALDTFARPRRYGLNSTVRGLHVIELFIK